MFYEKTVLPNGVSVVSETMSSVRSITLGVWVNTGSRDESANQAGLAHFMEHMMFKGTPTMSPLDISTRFDRIGAISNAFTSKSYTCFYARFVDDKLEDALSLLADMVVNSTFPQNEINTEREVVIEEIARSIDTPDDYVFELFSSSLLQGHELGLPILGTKERVGSYEHSDCIAFHDQHYRTGNICVAAAGNVNHDQLVEMVSRFFDGMPQGDKEQRCFHTPTYHSGLYCEQRDIEQAHIVLGFPWHALGDERRYASSVLTAILGGSMSSRLFQEIREKRGLAYSVFPVPSTCQDAGSWGVYAGTRPANVAEVVSLIRTELARIVDEPVGEEELTRTIDMICGQMLLGLESTNTHMTRLGKCETLDQEQVSPEVTEARYRAVTAEEVQKVAQDFLTAEETIAVVSPHSEEDLQNILYA